MDVEAAFLNGDLEEEIYMDCPNGMTHFRDECLYLQKAIYGLVQAARQFFKKFIRIMTNIGFKQSVVEPCLLYKKDENGIVITAIHVDDCYMIGHRKALDQTVKDIEAAKLTVKVEHNTKDYLSCEIVFDKEKKKAWLGQPHLVKRLENKFESLLKGSHVKYKTPGTPGYNIVRPAMGDVHLNEEDQKIYRSGVGTLLQFIKHSPPDISNTVRELSKCMDKASPAAFKEMVRVMKFLLGTNDYGLRIQPAEVADQWNLSIYTDSDWAGDKENRRKSQCHYLVQKLNIMH
jgi:Reverse transcriptase (RNA-dependent DNA polymerase)